MMRRSLRDVRVFGEVTLLVVLTWLALGFFFDGTITQLDGAAFLTPYTRSQLAAGGDWTEHLYRFGVLGGAPMHPYAGTLPLVEVASALGLSTTTAVNLGTLFLQVALGFFGLLAVEALCRRTLAGVERAITFWLCAFMPVIAWRLALGHENIIQGVLPLVVGCALLGAAHTNRLTPVALLLGFFVVWNAVSGLGGQLLVYSAVFGAPVIACVLAGVRPWTARTLAVVLVMIAAVAVALPRVSVMLDYAASEDASRRLGDAVTYELGAARWRDWLGSLAWSREAASGALVHEANYPFGPLLCLIAGLWPRDRSRALLVALAASLVLAILFAADVPPVSTALVPLLGAFRVPARAVLPIVVLLPMVAAAVVWIARGGAKSSRLVDGLGVALAVLVIAWGEHVPSVVREVLAWISCGGLVVLLHWHPARGQQLALALTAVVAALGVAAFDERLAHRLVPTDPIERGPAQLRALVVEEDPAAAMPLTRIQLYGAPLPYRVGLGFAAGLSTLDGDFNPPRRFLELLSATSGRPVPSTTVIFELGRSRAFALLQQLYNVRLAVAFTADGVSLERLPPTPGPAWLPRTVEVRPDATRVAEAMWRQRSALGDTAWVMPPHERFAGTCTGAVASVAASAQTASVAVRADTSCVLVVAASYVAMLHATTATGESLDVFPIDIALTGIRIPPGMHVVTLQPVVHVSTAMQLAGWLGWLLLVAAIAISVRADVRARAPAPPPPQARDAPP